MKITIYELLGLVKDGKAPNKIKYMDYIFEYDTNHKRYESYINEQIWTLNDFVNVDDNLTDKVEILEEEKKIPEKLKIELNDNDENKVNWYRATNLECELAQKYNGIIDYLKSKGE